MKVRQLKEFIHYIRKETINFIRAVSHKYQNEALKYIKH